MDAMRTPMARAAFSRRWSKVAGRTGAPETVHGPGPVLLAPGALRCLDYRLIADTGGEIARRFGVPVREGGSLDVTLDGERHRLTRSVTASRWTFVIDREGRIVHRSETADAGSDGRAVLEFMRSQLR